MFFFFSHILKLFFFVLPYSKMFDISISLGIYLMFFFGVCQCWEENPDVYGIRRSGRSRKEPERLRVNESDSGEKVHSKRNSRQSSRT